MMKKMILMSIALMLVLVACKEEPQPTLNEIYASYDKYFMDPDFKDYFTPAGEGSWFIYYDSLTNIFDTVQITEVETPLYSGFDATYLSESYSVAYSGTFMDFGIGAYTTPPGPTGSTNPGEVAYSMNIRFGSETGPSVYYGETTGFSIVDWDDHTYIDSVVIAGQTFYDIIECKSSYGVFKTVWFAKGIGPIRRVRKSDYTRDLRLIDYHIEPNPIGTRIGKYK